MLWSLADKLLLQSKKRGLSLEEKKAAVLSVFHETKDVYTLKVLAVPSWHEPGLLNKMLGCRDPGSLQDPMQFTWELLLHILHKCSLQ